MMRAGKRVPIEPAFHEAGHAAAAWLLRGERAFKIQIYPEGGGHTFVSTISRDYKHFILPGLSGAKRKKIVDRIELEVVETLAGPIVENLRRKKPKRLEEIVNLRVADRLRWYGDIKSARENVKASMEEKDQADEELLEVKLIALARKSLSLVSTRRFQRLSTKLAAAIQQAPFKWSSWVLTEDAIRAVLSQRLRR